MRDSLRSHFVVVLALFIAIPLAAWGALVLADMSASVLPVKASPLEEAQLLISDAKRRLPWAKGWVLYSTRDEGSDALRVSFSYPQDALARSESSSVVSVTFLEDEEPALLVGDGHLLALHEDEILDARESSLKGVRLREVWVKRHEAADERPSWWTEEHRLYVIDRSADERLVVAYSDEFKDIQRFLEGLSWWED